MRSQIKGSYNCTPLVDESSSDLRNPLVLSLAGIEILKYATSAANAAYSSCAAHQTSGSCSILHHTCIKPSLMALSNLTQDGLEYWASCKSLWVSRQTVEGCYICIPWYAGRIYGIYHLRASLLQEVLLLTEQSVIFESIIFRAST